ncbi:hypothetical protein O181_044463 [Austropuccinia psidii MF-1]|uniref:Uncharacterized protein n=1 Tax=Austropuccinia psidii MF-1 TaxID=1389203 RepID=A0A9Q3DQ45_9BASI|nr:hypothetical protein [Austropuccinia psidii MF-1]
MREHCFHNPRSCQQPRQVDSPKVIPQEAMVEHKPPQPLSQSQECSEAINAETQITRNQTNLLLVPGGIPDKSQRTQKDPLAKVPG